MSWIKNAVLLLGDLVGLSTSRRVVAQSITRLRASEAAEIAKMVKILRPLASTDPTTDDSFRNAVANLDAAARDLEQLKDSAYASSRIATATQAGGRVQTAINYVEPWLAGE